MDILENKSMHIDSSTRRQENHKYRHSLPKSSIQKFKSCQNQK